MLSKNDLLDTILDEKEAELAKTAQRCIVAALDHSKAVNLALVEDGVERLTDGAPLLRLPPKVLRLFANILGALSQGKPVAVMPQSMDLTTQQAAMLLNVSRPYLVGLLESGKIQFHKVGKHRRVSLEDVLKFKEERRQASAEALAALTEQAQELGMGY
jgi:excisionase family DNA binding protein